MAKPQSKRKRRSRSRSAPRRGGGVMSGMRRGFKNVAHSVTGQPDARNKKTSLAGTIITIVLILAIAALLFYR